MVRPEKNQTLDHEKMKLKPHQSAIPIQHLYPQSKRRHHPQKTGPLLLKKMKGTHLPLEFGKGDSRRY